MREAAIREIPIFMEKNFLLRWEATKHCRESYVERLIQGYELLVGLICEEGTEGEDDALDLDVDIILTINERIQMAKEVAEAKYERNRDQIDGFLDSGSGLVAALMQKNQGLCI
ncbi:MAG: hypothetical protein ACE5FT_01510 [Candidatus Nanoarchaeia archaeon]